MTTVITQTLKTLCPDLPRDMQIADTNGKLTAIWALFFQQLTTALQTNFKSEGFVIPPLSDTNIDNLGDTDASVGNIIYDSVNKVFKGIVLVTEGSPNVPPVTATKTFTLT